MVFTTANPSVVRSIKQRVLLDAWLRAARRSVALPAIAAFRLDDTADDLADMMTYAVVGQKEEARFRITQEGARLAATYGSEHIEPHQRTNRFLDEAIGPARYARVLPSYMACLMRKRPTYSVSTVQDADGKDVSYERLLLPFGSADAVEEIIGSYKAISIEGGFKIANLMGITTKTTPVSVVNAVIDLDFAHGPSSRHAAQEVIELS